MQRFLKKPENETFAESLRHVAIELVETCNLDDMAELVRQRAINLHTLSIVSPSTASSTPTTATFLPPTRRCRLRKIPRDTADKMEVTELFGFYGAVNRGLPMPLRTFLDGAKQAMDDHVQQSGIQGPEGDAWSSYDCCFDGLSIKAQTFVEFRLDRDGCEQWVEVCQDRRLGGYEDRSPDSRSGMPGLVLVADRKSPEEYRVLDEDNHLYTGREVKAMFKRANAAMGINMDNRLL